MSLDTAISFIRSHRNFLVTVHSNIDGDALGSELAFARLLKKMGKSCLPVNDDKIPYGYEFLPGLKAIRRYRKGMKLPPIDAMAVLDCSDMKRTGQTWNCNRGEPILNIDHHVSNSRFGRVNWVDPRACCACELVYELYKRLKVPIDRESAMLLYVGILTDTGSFRFSNTSPRTHLMTAQLLKTGISASDIYKKIYSSVPYEDMKLLSRILPTMQTDAEGRVVWFQLPRKLLAGRGGLSFDLSESILNFARSVKGVEVAILFKENLDGGKEVRVNFRSQGHIDVNRIAGSFGGGGHKTAAGMTVRGKSLQQVTGSVLSKVRAVLNGE
jgi:bifunctional oligoribonuclease and PAP phosphatase NrnA